MTITATKPQTCAPGLPLTADEISDATKGWPELKRLFRSPKHHGDIEKSQIADQLSETLSNFKLEYWPGTHTVDDEGHEVCGPGYSYAISGRHHGEFPALGFEAWIDGRDNDGDLAQSLVDEVCAIARLYAEAAQGLARELERTPNESAVVAAMDGYRR